MTHPISQLLSARLACIEAGIDSSSVWFYGDRTPESESVIRAWAAEHGGIVTISKCSSGFSVDHRKLHESIVCWYPQFDEPRATEPSAESGGGLSIEPVDWRPSDGVQP